MIVGLIGEVPWFTPDAGEATRFVKARGAFFAAIRGMAGAGGSTESDRPQPTTGTTDRRTGDGAAPGRFVSAALLVAAATGLNLLLRPYLQVGSLVLPFLISILLAAIAYGLLPSLLASVLSVLTLDYLFLPPFYSLTIADPDDEMRLAVFALTALIVSNLAAYARRQAVAATLRAEVAEDLYRFGRQLAGTATLRELVSASLPRLTAMLRTPVRIVLMSGEDLCICPPTSGNPNTGDIGAGFAEGGVTEEELTNIKSWLQRDANTESDAPAPASGRWRFVPMRTARAKVGVLVIARDDLDRHHVPNSAALLGTLADLMAQAIDRVRLVEDLNQASRAAAREELHAALLASLSHDLRTPLAAVLGSAESLIAVGEAIGSEARRHLAGSIQNDARRLDRYIGNLLDMTRLEAGLGDATMSALDLADVVNAALDRAGEALSGHRLSVALENDLPLIAGDEVLLEHVLFNLLDNAAKYAPPGSLIQLRAKGDGDQVVIEVIDEGQGIRPADLERVFDKFYRGQHQEPGTPGIGLGLAICSGYVEVMDGRIAAHNRTDRGGAVFTITLPISAQEDALESAA
jgi:two-component system sensor histidine kinase KdpD